MPTNRIYMQSTSLISATITQYNLTCLYDFSRISNEIKINFKIRSHETVSQDIMIFGYRSRDLLQHGVITSGSLPFGELRIDKHRLEY